MTRTRTRTIRTALAAIAALALALGLVACGGDDDDSSGSSSAGTTTAKAEGTAAITKNADNASTTLTIGSKNFTEQQVLGEIYAQALAAAGYNVKKELNLGDEQTALKALKGGDISGYPEYTGTALLSFFEVPTKDLPKDPAAAYDEVKSKFAEQGITAFPATPFTSSNEVAVTQQTADELGAEEHLGPRGQVAGPHALRVPRVPRPRRLPSRAAERLRPEVQEVRPGRHRAAP